MEAISFFMAPMAMCFLLIGIHCYLGIHVLKRGVIFIDLSLAQVAALGGLIGSIFHIESSVFGSYFFSLLCSFMAAFLFAWARKYEKWISQEVLIGVVYAFSSSLAILFLQNMSHGGEHLKEILVGKILWVSWADVLKTGAIYSVVSLIHYFLRGKMLAVSEGKAISHKVFWDFIFFALFGVVISSSVGAAGILLVFSFLIVPALVSSFFSQTIRTQLFLGWMIGILVSFIGMYVSFRVDLPAGAVLVVCFTSLPILSLFALSFRSTE